jgi:hypothetical protein
MQTSETAKLNLQSNTQTQPKNNLKLQPKKKWRTKTHKQKNWGSRKRYTLKATFRTFN